MKNPCRVFVASVAMLGLFAGAALAQDVPVKVMRAPVGTGTGGGNSETVGNLLYCDVNNNTAYGTASQSFSDFLSFNSFTWDDFSIPDNEIWTIDGFSANGFYTAGVLPTGCPTNYFFRLTADLGGTPDCNNAFLNITVSPGAAGFSDVSGNWTFCPPGGGAVTLPCGKYWFSAGINMSFASPLPCGQWFWFGSTTPHRNCSIPYFNNPGGAFGCAPCLPFTDPCFGIEDHDKAYKIYGTSTGKKDFKALRAGNVSTGNGGSGPVDVIFLNASVGDPNCRTLSVLDGECHTLDIIPDPCSNKGQYGIWIYKGEQTDCKDVVVRSNKGVTAFLGQANQALPSNNTDPNACPAPCPTADFFGVGNVGVTSRTFGGGTAALLCLQNKNQATFSRSPTSFTVKFPCGPGKYQIYCLTQDVKSQALPERAISISNSIVVCVL